MKAAIVLAVLVLAASQARPLYDVPRMPGLAPGFCPEDCQAQRSEERQRQYDYESHKYDYSLNQGRP
jgi:hypothetical protein